jgi:hypothetical protein
MIRRERAQHAGLAHARLTGDEHQMPARHGLAEAPVQRLQDRFTFDQVHDVAV